MNFISTNKRKAAGGKIKHIFSFIFTSVVFACVAVVVEELEEKRERERENKTFEPKADN